MKTISFNHLTPGRRLTGWSATKYWITPVALLLALAASAWAQSVTMKANPLRITVPLGSTQVTTSTVTIVTANLAEGNVVNFAVTGVPAGVSATLSTNSVNVNGTHTAELVVSSTAALAQGTHDVAIQASGDASYRLPVPVICSYVWGGANHYAGVSSSLTSAGNWIGGVVPGATDDVVFGNSGGTTNTSGDTTTNVVIAADKEIGSLRFAQANVASNRYFNVEFQAGAKLLVTGAGGYAQLRDAKVPLASQNQDVRMFGNGSLVVSNTAANFAMLVDGQLTMTLDLRDLDNLYVDVNRLPIGDYRAYPNFFTNGWVGSGTGNEVSRFAPNVYLARTNIIKAAHVDANNYGDLGWRDYALTIGNYSEQGTTANLRFQMGDSNAFFLDSICFSQALQGGGSHNYNFIRTNSYALFRGIGGMSSRMSVFAIGDAASPAAPRSANTRGQVNFANQAGCAVDALVDRLWVAVDRTNSLNQMTIQASLTFAQGTFDVNDAYLGYQLSGDNQGDPAATGFAGPEGTVNVNSNANSAGGVFRVNRNLHLGYTTATAPGGTSSPERAFGRVVVNGGTLMVSNIVIGGVTKLSTNNLIALNGAKLMVTNTIGADDARLTRLVITNGSQVVLHGVKVGETNVFVNVLSAPVAGASSTITIPSIAGLSTFPVTIPLVSYQADAPIFNGLAIVPPPGLFVQSLVDNTTDKTIDLTLTDRPPLALVWKGNINNQWDTATKNWETLGGLQTNFVNGDSVIFNDTATLTSIVIPAPVAPGQSAATFGMVVSNSTKSYTFSSGDIIGGSTLKKVGSGSLTIDATVAPGLIISGGSLAGVGTVGPTLLEDGATMTAFTGTINGGLAVSNATATVKGPVFGGLVVQAGTLLNNNVINGSVSLATNVTLNNAIGATMNVVLPWSVPTNSILVNNGTIVHSGAVGGNQGLTVNGQLRGTGKITQSGTQASSDVRVTIGAGGTLMIGNNPGEIATKTIAVRLDFLATSTTTVDVNNDTASLDKILLTDGFIQGKVNFGAGNSLGGTFVINKVAGPPFDLATTLNFFDTTFNLPDNVNQAIPGVIPPPAPGLVWDVSRTVSNLTVKVMGPLTVTNFVNVDTNGTSLVFEWPEQYRGWRLERQTNALSVGLELNSTNWVTLANSFGGTNLFYPDTNDLSQFHFRSTQLITDEDGEPVFPAAFYRMAYP